MGRKIRRYADLAHHCGCLSTTGNRKIMNHKPLWDKPLEIILKLTT
jgi:hypothetical protein